MFSHQILHWFQCWERFPLAVQFPFSCIQGTHQSVIKYILPGQNWSVLGGTNWHPSAVVAYRPQIGGSRQDVEVGAAEKQIMASLITVLARQLLTSWLFASISASSLPVNTLLVLLECVAFELEFLELPINSLLVAASCTISWLTIVILWFTIRNICLIFIPISVQSS